ncbi:MAG TPA: sialidase family protein [Candidatus Acidoferrales bacterium]|nr:sialidase family protein [Candidatus Acidoferrales bacterium]
MIRKGLVALALCFSSTACATHDRGQQLHFEAVPIRISPNAIGTAQFQFGAAGDIEAIASVERDGTAQLEAFSSRTQGNDFVDEGPISPAHTGIDVSAESSPRFAMDRDELLYALWREDNPSQQLFVAIHDWRTGKYTAPIAVRDAGARGFAGFGNIAAGPGNAVYMVWLDERDLMKSGDASAVYFASMKDGRVSRNVRVASSTCSCCRPAIAVASNGTIYVAWRHDDRDLRDMAVASSHDGGRTFSPLHYVAHDGWKLHGCPESGPSLLVVRNRLYVAWFTMGADARPRVLLAHSDDGGATFSAAAEISAPTLDANHPMLFALKPSGVGVVFQARDPRSGGGWSHLVPYFAQIRQDGTATEPQPIASPGTADATYPYAVSRDAQSLFVSYSLGSRAELLRGRSPLAVTSAFTGTSVLRE